MPCGLYTITAMWPTGLDLGRSPRVCPAPPPAQLHAVSTSRASMTGTCAPFCPSSPPPYPERFLRECLLPHRYSRPGRVGTPGSLITLASLSRPETPFTTPTRRHTGPPDPSPCLRPRASGFAAPQDFPVCLSTPATWISQSPPVPLLAIPTPLPVVRF